MDPELADDDWDTGLSVTEKEDFALNRNFPTSYGANNSLHRLQDGDSGKIALLDFGHTVAMATVPGRSDSMSLSEEEKDALQYQDYTGGDLNWQGDYGDIIVQCNVEDWRFGVAEYAVQKLDVETVELKWGQGAKCIGGEIKIKSLERALELQGRGYIITPNPSDADVQTAFKTGAIKEFERHSRLGFIEEDNFLRMVEYLRRTVGAKRVTLKTGSYGFRELAMAIKWSSEARVDLLTIDGSGGGTGMSPWRMMQEWGVPTFYLQCMAYECAQKLASRGKWVPDLAMAGGFTTEDHIFKVLAMGDPYFKAVCLGRALMIPGFVGDNIQGLLEDNADFKNWEKFPNTVSRYGQTPEEIFVTYSTLQGRYGDRMKDMPLGAVAFYTFVDKLRTGLTQFMAGARNFRLDTVKRDDVMCLTEEAAQVSGIKYVMDAYREEADKILSA